jgi:hypothetical protein
MIPLYLNSGWILVLSTLASLELSQSKHVYTQLIYHDDTNNLKTSFSCDNYECNQAIPICYKPKYVAGYYLERSGLTSLRICRTNTKECCGEMDKFGEDVVFRSNQIRAIDDIMINDCSHWVLYRHKKLAIRTTPVDEHTFNSKSLTPGTFDKGYLLSESLEMCVSKKNEDINHDVKCIDGVLYSNTRHCKLWIDDTEFEFSDCDSRQLPLYTDEIAIAFDGVYQQVKCEISDICSVYHRMSHLNKLRYWNCNKGLLWFTYFLVLLFVISLTITLIGVVKYYLVIVPLKYTLKFLINVIPGAMRRLFRSKSNDSKLYEIPKEQENQETEEMTTSKRGTRYMLTDGSYSTAVFLIILLLPLVMSACRDNLDSVTSLSTCTSSFCNSVTTINLKLRSIGDEACLKFTSGSLNIRVIGARMQCNSEIEYHTRKYKYEVTKDDYKCYTGPDCVLNPSTSLWNDEDLHLHHDYCVYESVGTFSCGIPFMKSSHWKRMKVIKADDLVCSAESCKSFKPHLVVLIRSENSQTIADIGDTAYKKGGYIFTIDSVSQVILPTKFVRCGDYIYDSTFNDVGDLSDDHYGSVQCPDIDSATHLTKMCKIKYEHLYEHTSNILMKQGDIINKQVNDSMDTDNKLFSTQYGYYTSTENLWPITLQIKTLNVLKESRDDEFIGEVLTCSMKGVARLIGGVQVSILVKSLQPGWALITCEDISSFRLNFNKQGDYQVSKYISIFSHSSKEKEVKCNITTSYTAKEFMCKTDLREHTLKLYNDLNNIDTNIQNPQNVLSVMTFTMNLLEENPKTCILSITIIMVIVFQKLIRSK